MRTRVIGIALVAALQATSTTQAFADYEPGGGLRLFDDRLLIGGYFGIEGGSVEGAADQVTISDLSALVTYNFTPTLRLFTEMELEELLTVDSGGLDAEENFVVERLYLEYEPAFPVRTRVGQFLTPIGIWNEIHALPLVWTTSRPAASTLFFDTGTTGARLDNTLRLGDLDLTTTLFGQATNQIDETNGQQKIRRGVGARARLASVGAWHASGSYLRFRDQRDRRSENVFAADVLFEAENWEITSELALNDPDGGATTWSAYLQAVYDLGAGFYPVVRYEHIDGDTDTDDPVIIGLTFKPRPFLVYKIEGIIGRGAVTEDGDETDIGNGFLVSFSVLF